MSDNENIEFKFSYLALKLLGKNLYSNAWAALSELVANSLDANAKDIYLYIDMRDKRNSTIEVFDNGDGMSYAELRNNYVHIGRNRRLDQENSENVMGRKGIGKLAALYLSRHYYVSTKTEGAKKITYEMDFSKEKEDSNDEHPEMNKVDFHNFDNSNFNDFSSGTMIRMEDVDLKGYADVSIKSLNNVLSDFFAIDSMNEKNIYLKIVTSDSTNEVSFEKIKKVTPFNNMVQILCFDDETYKRLKQEHGNNYYSIGYKKFKEHTYTGNTEVIREKLEKKAYFVPPKIDNENSETKYGEIKGWIGIHSSIEKETAKANDPNFEKNKLYNPMKLRVYVRNKLAIDNFLPVINNTQVFVNFIEGEISYDVLDDNDFPDIATTSRQNMDENDRRVIDLAEEMRSKITQLIRKRQKLSKIIADNEADLTQKSNTAAKAALAETIDKTVQKVTKESEQNNEALSTKADVLRYAEEIKSSVLKNVQGETIKNNYKIFFSHSRKNKEIIDFFHRILKSIGVKEEEMFYTSKDNRPEIEVKQSLANISKSNILDTNTIMFFYSTKEFLESEYCMFEGGAAWATRTQEDFFIVFDEYDNIPKYLSFADEFLLGLTKETNILIGNIYNGIIQSLNFLIKHINVGREINQESKVSLFSEVDFPDKVEMKKGIRPHLNEDVITYWNEYVNNGIYEEARKQKYI